MPPTSAPSLAGPVAGRGAATRPHAHPAAVGPVRWSRVVAGSLAVAVVASVIGVVVRGLPDTAAGSVLALVLGLAVVPLVASPLEWVVHRFVYHQTVIGLLAPIHTVHTVHHAVYFPTWRYVTGGPARRLAITNRSPRAHRSAPRNAGVRLAHFGWYMGIGVVAVWTPAWLFTRNQTFLLGVVVASALVSNLFIVVHDTIHRPGSHRVVEAMPWYPFLDRHHFIHHVDLGANLNFLLPLADLLFGTLRTTMSAQEVAGHGTLEEAKARPEGDGGPARERSAR